MSKRTKKVGISGKYGSKYGRKLRLMFNKIENLQRAKYVCPSCKAKKLRRTSAGIWECKKCGAKIAGGAYKPSTKGD